MTLAEFRSILKKTNLPVAYLEFPEETCPDMPFIVYQEVGKNAFSADDMAYVKAHQLQVDLYTKTKDEAMEELLESVLDEASIFYNCSADPENDELCHRMIYEMEV